MLLNSIVSLKEFDMSMNCPQCGAWTRVLETRTKVTNVVSRRYECANLHKFTTIESVKVQEPKPPRSEAHQ